ncbi:MAG: hypothetical protein LBU70_00865 [Chitinispirillales bacterium]|nr:hypothetical protein [Chitinispirillales bacterium]
MNKNHIFEKISMLLLFFASIFVLVGFIPIRSDRLSRGAEKMLAEAGADSVSVGGISGTLFGGMRISNLCAYKRINANESYHIHVERIDVASNLFWLAVTMPFHRSLFSSERDMFHDAYKSPLGFVGALCDYWMAAVPVKKIILRGASVSFTDKKGLQGIAFSGISAKLSRVKKGIGTGTPRLVGSVTVAEAIIPTLAIVENFSAELDASAKTLGIGGSGSIFGGELEASLILGLTAKSDALISGMMNEYSIVGGNARIKGLDLGQYVVGTKFSPGSISGKLDLEAQLKPSRADIDSIEAEGSAVITNLVAVNLALQNTRAVNRLSGDLRTLRFSEVRSDIQFSGGRVNFREMVGIGGVLSFRSTGWIDFDGRLNHNFVGEFSPSFISALPRLIRNSFERTANGGGRFNCRITGTFHRPNVEIDRSMYNRAIRNVFRR